MVTGRPKKSAVQQARKIPRADNAATSLFEIEVRPNGQMLGEDRTTGVEKTWQLYAATLSVKRKSISVPETELRTRARGAHINYHARSASREGQGDGIRARC